MASLELAKLEVKKFFFNFYGKFGISEIRSQEI